MSIASKQKLETFVDQSLAQRLELNEMLPSLDYVRVQQKLRPELGCQYFEVGGGMAFWTGPDSPLNQCIGMGLHGAVSEAEFDRFEEIYRSRNVPAQLVLSPYADPSVMKCAAERGYAVTEFNTVLIRRLRSGERFDIEGVTIERVRPGTARKWAEVLTAGFSDVGEIPAELFEPYGLLPNSISFIAYIDGKPAASASGTVYPEHKLAALFGASTLPEYRNRGLQNAMFRARLRAAVEAGCELAVVCAHPGSQSQRNAERQGFRVAYTKVVMVRRFE